MFTRLLTGVMPSTQYTKAETMNEEQISNRNVKNRLRSQSGQQQQQQKTRKRNHRKKLLLYNKYNC